tara:strand:- start:1320 stop:2978 length:1659 start_codon:yes stop_codon:yes gene_type:complete
MQKFKQSKMIKEEIKRDVEITLEYLSIDSKNVIIQEPRNHDDVDYATNIALIASKRHNKNPMDIAQDIANTMKSTNNDYYLAITIAKPGFINFKLNSKQYLKRLVSILKSGNEFGKSNIGNNKKALIEFVSANPTGPLTIGHGRGAIIGEFASNILDWNGFTVEREYYFNNAGRQMRKLAESVQSKYLDTFNIKNDFPEDGYQGEYISTIAQEMKEDFSKKFIEENKIDEIKNYAEEKIFNKIKLTLKNLQIEFDNFFNEKDLYDNKAIFKIIESLKKEGLVYEKDGATWFSATKLGLTQDRVLIKSSGEPTYRLPDMAYHQDKFNRNYDLIIDVFGADHLDAYPDVLAVCKHLGNDTKKMRVLVHQFVTIQESGKPVKMSTRKANFISLDDLINEVGADVVKYFFSMRGINSHLNFDLNLAKDQSDQNPVFYIQYAYARSVNIINKSKDTGLYSIDDLDFNQLSKPEEINLIKCLLKFPELIIKSSDDLEPQLIANYLMETASKFHQYYAKHKVVSDNKELSIARTILVDATRQILFNGLTVLGLSTPNKM